jgi:hypothetical protein
MPYRKIVGILLRIIAIPCGLIWICCIAIAMPIGIIAWIINGGGAFDRVMVTWNDLPYVYIELMDRFKS